MENYQGEFVDIDGGFINKFCLQHKKTPSHFYSDFLGSISVGACADCAVKMAYLGLEFV